MLKVLYAELHHYQTLIATAIQHGAFLNPSSFLLAIIHLAYANMHFRRAFRSL